MKKWIFILTALLSNSAIALSQEEINQQNAAAEAACNANKNYGEISANDLFDLISSDDYKTIFGMLKDEAAYQACARLTPKKIATYVAKLAPKLVDEIDLIINSTKSDTQKGKDIQALLETEMSPQYGYANNRKASITMSPSLGIAKLSWTDDMQSRNCDSWKVAMTCDSNGNNCVVSGSLVKEYDSIYPMYSVRRVVNGKETLIGQIKGSIKSSEKTIIDISPSSPDTLLAKIGKDLVKRYIQERLQTQNNNQPDAVNLVYDNDITIFKNSSIKYKITASDPGLDRQCTDEAPYSSWSYYLNYDINADGVPDFVNQEWYNSKVGPVHALMTMQAIQIILL